MPRLIDLIRTKTDLDKIKKLVATNPQVLREDDDGHTPVSAAAELGNAHVVKFLLERGCAGDAHDDIGQSPLHIAAEKGHKDVIQVLVDDGRVPLEDRNISGYTPLLVACAEGFIECVEFLLDRRASIDAHTLEQKSVLHLAAENGNPELITLLLNRLQQVRQRAVEPVRLNINIKDRSGNTPLHLAAMRNNTDAMKVLLDAGARIEERNDNGKTALHVAAQAPKALALLLDIVMQQLAEKNNKKTYGAPQVDKSSKELSALKAQIAEKDAEIERLRNASQQDQKAAPDATNELQKKLKITQDKLQASETHVDELIGQLKTQGENYMNEIESLNEKIAQLKDKTGRSRSASTVMPVDASREKELKDEIEDLRTQLAQALHDAEQAQLSCYDLEKQLADVKKRKPEPELAQNLKIRDSEIATLKKQNENLEKRNQELEKALLDLQSKEKVRSLSTPPSSPPLSARQQEELRTEMDLMRQQLDLALSSSEQTQHELQRLEEAWKSATEDAKRLQLEILEKDHTIQEQQNLMEIKDGLALKLQAQYKETTQRIDDVFSQLRAKTAEAARIRNESTMAIDDLRKQLQAAEENQRKLKRELEMSRAQLPLLEERQRQIDQQLLLKSEQEAASRISFEKQSVCQELDLVNEQIDYLRRSLVHTAENGSLLKGISQLCSQL